MMNKKYVLGLVILAVTLGVLITTLAQNPTYDTFATASQHPDKKFTVIGELDLTQDINYQPEVNANIFSFYMRDKEQTTVQVILNEVKPYDFERAQQVTVTGKYREGVFYATELLLKCPSKYNEQKNIARP